MFTLIALLLAAAPAAGTKIQREAEDRARADAADLLRTLCPEQCVLLSVQARVDDEDVGGATTPGFDPAGARTVPVLRAINASVLIDQRLPTAFRGRVKSLVAQGGLFFLAARKPPAEPLFAEPLPPEEPAQSAASEAQREAFPAARARRLEKQITDDRALRNIVL